ncbi:MAG: DUF2231 domain-containing protein [Candidatus Neomarinimicrobiota bacterium]
MDIPFHSILVHFPIACIPAALIFQLLILRYPKIFSPWISLWLLGFAALFSMFSAVSGELEFSKAGEMNYSTEILLLLRRHALIGNLVTWGSLIIFMGWLYLLLKNQDDKRIYKLAFAFLILLTACVLTAAYLGGKLVWIYGVGIG